MANSAPKSRHKWPIVPRKAGTAGSAGEQSPALFFFRPHLTTCLHIIAVARQCAWLRVVNQYGFSRKLLLHLGVFGTTLSYMSQSKPKLTMHRTFKLDPALASRLDDVSRANRVGVSTVVRTALLQLIGADIVASCQHTESISQTSGEVTDRAR